MAEQSLGRSAASINLRARIMESRRNRYGLGPTVGTECTYAQWAAGLPKATLGRWTPPEPRAVPHLYFIGSASGPIKIGVSVNPDQRLRELRTSNPFLLRILAVVKDAGDQERAYHVRFAEHRLEGEWFNPAPEILAEIARLNSEKSA